FNSLFLNQSTLKSRVELSSLVYDCNARRATSINRQHERGYNSKERHHQRQENRCYNEHTTPHTLQVLTFNDGHKFSHWASLTFSIKMLCKLGSIISNFVTTAPESISCFKSSWGSAFSFNSTSVSSL